MTAHLWDEQARTLEDARAAVWSEPGDEAWDAGVHHCLDHVISHLPDRVTMAAELGCGIGRLLLPLARERTDVSFLGVDHSREMLLHLWGQHVNNVDVAWQSIDASLSVFGPFDFVYSVLTLQHVTDEVKVRTFGAVADALRPGGVFRLQYTVGDEHGPINHPVIDEGRMLDYAVHNGLKVVDSSVDEVYPTWRWATVVQ